jgi:hypothetical protein
MCILFALVPVIAHRRSQTQSHLGMCANKVTTWPLRITLLGLLCAGM